MDLTALADVGKIIAFNLILSGDNAVVIGLAASRLNPENRRRAIIIGGGCAVILRIVFTILVSFLLNVPLLRATGGVLLAWVAYRLALPEPENPNVAASDSMIEAIRTIIIADAIMSLDNMLAVGEAAHGHIWLILFGLGLSIPIVLFGSELVARLLTRYPVLIWIGIFVLLHTAINMIFGDEIVQDFIGEVRQPVVWILAISATALFYYLSWRRTAPSEPLVT